MDSVKRLTEGQADPSKAILPSLDELGTVSEAWTRQILNFAWGNRIAHLRKHLTCPSRSATGKWSSYVGAVYCFCPRQVYAGRAYDYVLLCMRWDECPLLLSLWVWFPLRFSYIIPEKLVMSSLRLLGDAFGKHSPRRLFLLAVERIVQSREWKLNMVAVCDQVGWSEKSQQYAR